MSSHNAFPGATPVPVHGSPMRTALFGPLPVTSSLAPRVLLHPSVPSSSSSSSRAAFVPAPVSSSAVLMPTEAAWLARAAALSLLEPDASLLREVISVAHRTAAPRPCTYVGMLAAFDAVMARFTLQSPAAAAQVFPRATVTRVNARTGVVHTASVDLHGTAAAPHAFHYQRAAAGGAGDRVYAALAQLWRDLPLTVATPVPTAQSIAAPTALSSLGASTGYGHAYGSSHRLLESIYNSSSGYHQYSQQQYAPRTSAPLKSHTPSVPPPAQSTLPELSSQIRTISALQARLEAGRGTYTGVYTPAKGTVSGGITGASGAVAAPGRGLGTAAVSASVKSDRGLPVWSHGLAALTPARGASLYTASGEAEAKYTSDLQSPFGAQFTADPCTPQTPRYDLSKFDEVRRTNMQVMLEPAERKTADIADASTAGSADAEFVVVMPDSLRFPSQRPHATQHNPESELEPLEAEPETDPASVSSSAMDTEAGADSELSGADSDALSPTSAALSVLLLLGEDDPAETAETAAAAALGYVCEGDSAEEHEYPADEHVCLEGDAMELESEILTGDIEGSANAPALELSYGVDDGAIDDGNAMLASTAESMTEDLGDDNNNCAASNLDVTYDGEYDAEYDALYGGGKNGVSNEHVDSPKMDVASEETRTEDVYSNKSNGEETYKDDDTVRDELKRDSSLDYRRDYSGSSGDSGVGVSPRAVPVAESVTSPKRLGTTVNSNNTASVHMLFSQPAPTSAKTFPIPAAKKVDDVVSQPQAQPPSQVQTKTIVTQQPLAPAPAPAPAPVPIPAPVPSPVSAGRVADVRSVSTARVTAACEFDWARVAAAAAAAVVAPTPETATAVQVHLSAAPVAASQPVVRDDWRFWRPHFTAAERLSALEGAVAALRANAAAHRTARDEAEAERVAAIEAFTARTLQRRAVRAWVRGVRERRHWWLCGCGGCQCRPDSGAGAAQPSARRCRGAFVCLCGPADASGRAAIAAVAAHARQPHARQVPALTLQQARPGLPRASRPALARTMQCVRACVRAEAAQSAKRRAIVQLQIHVREQQRLRSVPRAVARRSALERVLQIWRERAHDATNKTALRTTAVAESGARAHRRGVAALRLWALLRQQQRVDQRAAVQQHCVATIAGSLARWRVWARRHRKNSSAIAEGIALIRNRRKSAAVARWLCWARRQRERKQARAVARRSAIKRGVCRWRAVLAQRAAAAVTASAARALACTHSAKRALRRLAMLGLDRGHTALQVAPGSRFLKRVTTGADACFARAALVRGLRALRRHAMASIQRKRQLAKGMVRYWRARATARAPLSPYPSPLARITLRQRTPDLASEALWSLVCPYTGAVTTPSLALRALALLRFKTNTLTVTLGSHGGGSTATSGRQEYPWRSQARARALLASARCNNNTSRVRFAIKALKAHADSAKCQRIAVAHHRRCGLVAAMASLRSNMKPAKLIETAHEHRRRTQLHDAIARFKAFAVQMRASKERVREARVASRLEALRMVLNAWQRAAGRRIACVRLAALLGRAKGERLARWGWGKWAHEVAVRQQLVAEASRLRARLAERVSAEVRHRIFYRFVAHLPVGAAGIDAGAGAAEAAAAGTGVGMGAVARTPGRARAKHLAAIQLWEQQERAREQQLLEDKRRERWGGDDGEKPPAVGYLTPPRNSTTPNRHTPGRSRLPTVTFDLDNTSAHTAGVNENKGGLFASVAPVATPSATAVVTHARYSDDDDDTVAPSGPIDGSVAQAPVPLPQTLGILDLSSAAPYARHAALPALWAVWRRYHARCRAGARQKAAADALLAVFERRRAVGISERAFVAWREAFSLARATAAAADAVLAVKKHHAVAALLVHAGRNTRARAGAALASALQKKRMHSAVAALRAEAAHARAATARVAAIEHAFEAALLRESFARMRLVFVAAQRARADAATAAQHHRVRALAGGVAALRRLRMRANVHRAWLAAADALQCERMQREAMRQWWTAAVSQQRRRDALERRCAAVRAAAVEGAFRAWRRRAAIAKRERAKDLLRLILEAWRTAALRKRHVARAQKLLLNNLK